MPAISPLELARMRVAAMQRVVDRYYNREAYLLLHGHYPPDDYSDESIYSNPLIVTPNGPPAPVGS